jgi:hypothetical protein
MLLGRDVDQEKSKRYLASPLSGLITPTKIGAAGRIQNLSGSQTAKSLPSIKISGKKRNIRED